MSEKKTSLSLLKPHLASVIIAPLLKLFECVCELLVPFLVKDIIDNGLTAGGSFEGDSSKILLRCLLMFGFAIAGFLVTMITQYMASRTSTSFAYELKQEMYSRLLRLSPYQVERFGKNKALNLFSSDAPALQSGVQMFMRLLVRAPFLVIGTIVASFLINIYAGIVVITGLFLCAVIIVLVMALTPKRYDQAQSELDRLSYLGEDAIEGRREIRSFNLQEIEESKFKEASSSYEKKSMGIAKINALINPLTFAFVNLAIVLILYFGSYRLEETALGVGSIVALVSFLTQALTALIQFTRLVTSISKARTSRKRIDSFLSLEPEIIDGPVKEGKEGAPLFAFHDVSLSFGGEKNALSHLNFEIKEGESFGIIGGTGSGKSTLLSLMERYLDPTEGSIDYRGVPLKQWNLSSIRKDIAFVSQKSQILQASIEENLFPSLEDKQEDIDKALEEAMAKDFVSALPEGSKTLLQPGGSNLSGGQKQRILIARALLSKRKILFLDDATSALDYRTDASVRENLRKKKITTVLVSQRATSLSSCSKILVLDKGEAVGLGSHEELLSSCPIYREIYQMQVDQK